MRLKTGKTPNSEMALSNKVFLNPSDESTLAGQAGKEKYCEINGFIYTFDAASKVAVGDIGFSNVQRKVLTLALGTDVTVAPWQSQKEDIYLSNLDLEVDFLSKNKKNSEAYEVSDIVEKIKQNFVNQVWSVGQEVVMDFQKMNIVFEVKSTETVDMDAFAAGEFEGKKSKRGVLVPNTSISISKASGSTIKITGGGSMSTNTIFRPDFDFQKLGIGGLDKEFSDIFRRAFASRIFPTAVVQKLALPHVKGILLYGPPGTGKTLIARQIGQMLNGKVPKKVDGPELLNKYVGQSEENVRDLFKEAEIEYAERGDESELHIIILDELDAICRQRGSRNDSTGVGDTVVNQFLSKIDGVNSLNNILIIGMTNRKELIDDALLRPGRLEVQVEIALPDAHGREQIFNIHTAKMRESNFMGDDVSISKMAEITKNYSGSEIEGLVKGAASYAFNRQIDVADVSKAMNPNDIKITQEDFMNAFKYDIKPAFGVDEEEFENCAPNGIIEYGEDFKQLMNAGNLFVQQVENSDRTPIVSILLEGNPGTGKTSIASTLALNSGFPFIKVISPETLVGYSESQKAAKITQVFNDAYRSPFSVVVVDDLERLLDFVNIGPRFSNIILQTLLVLFKKPPPIGKKILIIGTTCLPTIVKDMGFEDVINSTLKVPEIKTKKELSKILISLGSFSKEEAKLASSVLDKGSSIPVKKLIMIMEMARQGEDGTFVERFQSNLLTFGLRM